MTDDIIMMKTITKMKTKTKRMKTNENAQHFEIVNMSGDSLKQYNDQPNEENSNLTL